MNPPILKGGQHRSAADVQSDAGTLAAIFAIGFLLLAFVLAWGAGR